MNYDEAWDKAYEEGEKEAEELFRADDAYLEWGNRTSIELALVYDDHGVKTDVLADIDLSDYFGNVEDAFEDMDIEYYFDVDSLKDYFVDLYATDYADEHVEDYDYEESANRKSQARKNSPRAKPKVKVKVKAKPKASAKKVAPKKKVPAKKLVAKKPTAKKTAVKKTTTRRK